ncbi:MAG: hypothetical protein PHX60_09810 [Giesbergeria sp.]|uniref:hypothetical protein n=1 Tax=Giesbergeria sp. TaxID=2818473 RepID=UPI00262F9B76|nr:hypothetical protein [Giesbergeria sp.]MDD2609972.1 hypothetical protein [Giesbergeria sp.]
MSTSLWDAPIWQDPGTWIVLGISLLFLVVGWAIHRSILKVMRSPSTAPPPAPGQKPPPPH